MKSGEHLVHSMNDLKQYEYLFRDWDKGGLGYKKVIDWINEHGDMNIKY